MGCGGGLLVSVLALYSEDPSSYPAGYLNFLNEKTKINEKEAGFGPLKKTKTLCLVRRVSLNDSHKAKKSSETKIDFEKEI